MDYRKVPLVTGEYYHIYNRGVAKAPTFFDKRDYEQIILSAFYYRFSNLPMKLSRLKELSKDARAEILKRITNEKRLVEIIAYVMMPNHFHFLLKQDKDNGIAWFVSQLTNSYTRYFNTRHERIGPLFQGTFKTVHVNSEEQLLHLSRYIHLNPLTAYVVEEKNFLSYEWSSLKSYLTADNSLVSIDLILRQFSSTKKYLDWILDQKDYQRELKKVDFLAIEN